MEKKNLVLLLVALFTHITNCVVELTLTSSARSKVFDRTSGTLYLGLEGGSTSAISKFYRFSGSGTPISAGIATGDLSGKIIEFLALSGQGCDETPLLAAVAQDASTPADYEQKIVYALTSDGKTVTPTDVDLNDANVSGNTTEGIVHLEASNTKIFAAVRPEGNNFGDTKSGIALMTLDKDTAVLTVKDATTGVDGNRAQLFDETSATLGIANDVAFIAIGNPTTTNESIRLYWSTTLQRLYLATNVTAGVGGARSIAVARVASDILTIGQLAPNGAFAANYTNIIGTTNSITLQARNIRVMCSSTGPSYLIVNGNVDPSNNGLNSVYALPLVDNTANATEHGTLARKDSSLTNGKFTVPATANAHLPTINDAAAQIGTNPLPIEAENVPSDLVVVGDTVYVSLDQEKNSDNDSGIFYSQALFDETGKIVRWTPWTKRATPLNTFPSKTANENKSKVFFMEVDAVNGRLWAVDGHNQKQLATTVWGFGSDAGSTTPTTLAGTLNSSLGSGCFSVLDLDQSTHGLGTSSPARYALFGGMGKVIFTRVSQSRSPGAPYDYAAGTNIPYPQTVITDFSSSGSVLESSLPGDECAVVALEYSRRLAASTNQNYFFAGTQGGLYAFARSSGTGFTIDATVDALNAAPFLNGQWQKVSGIEGSVVALKTSGHENTAANNGALYVLTLQPTTDPAHPLISRIYSMPFDVNVATMSSNIRLIAQSEVTATNSDLTDAKMILGMQIISTTNDGSTEQLVIATNHGLYRSHASEGGGNAGIIDAANQAAALWQPISVGGTTAYYNIFGIDNALIPTTAWPLAISDEKGLKTYGRAAINQLHGTANANTFSFVPNPFNSSGTIQGFQTLPASNFFWSDGARRFFIIKREGDDCCRNRLMVLPFDASEWCTTSPNVYISDATLATTCSFNWVSHIGATGILMAGINTGVAALE